MPSVAFQNWWNASPGSDCTQALCEDLPDAWNNGDEAYSLPQEHERLVHRLLGIRQFILGLRGRRRWRLRRWRRDTGARTGSWYARGFLRQRRVFILFSQFRNAPLQILAHLHMFIVQHS